jgi:hypothetical protein
MSPADPANRESDAAAAAALIEYLKMKVLRRPDLALDASTPLVSSGLVDSFALVSVLGEIERVTRTRIPAGRVSPEDLDSVEKMIETARRVGRPRE